MSSIWTMRRSATDAKIAGVCGGVAEHWGVDPVLVRVGWVLLALSGGVGVVLYAAGWLLVPVQGRATAPVHDLFGDAARRWSTEVWLALVALACVAVVAVFGKVAPFGFGTAAAVAVLWYLGSTRLRRGRTPTGPAGTDGLTSSEPAVPAFLSHPGPPTPFTAAADAWRLRIEEHARLSTITAPPPPPAGAAAPPPPTAWAARPDPDPEQAARAAFWAEPDPVGLYGEPPGPRTGVPARAVRPASPRSARRLRLATVLVLGLVGGGLALADVQGLDVPTAMYAAAALLVVGLALVAATWLGRARGLLGLGLLLVPTLALTAALGTHSLQNPWPERRVDYTTAAELPAQGDTQAHGQLVVDLRGLALDADARYAAHVGTGRLEVVAPRDTNVVLRYTVQQGVATAFGQELQVGVDLVGAGPPPAAITGAPTLTLDLSVDHGHLEVRR